MKSITKIKVIRIFLGFFLIGLGMVAGIAIRHYHDLPIAETFNIVDIATLITTIFIAVYVPSVLDKQMQVKQEKKDIITKRIEDIQSIYRKINTIVQQDMTGRSGQSMLKSNIDLLPSRMETLGKLVGYLDTKKGFKKEVETISFITSEYRQLLQSLEENGSDFPYPESVKKKEELLYNRMDQTTSLLLFKLSDA